MAPIASTDVDVFLKKQYIPQAVEFMAFQEFPLLGMLKKNTQFGAGGTNGTMDLVVGTEYPQGATADFTTAQTNAATAYPRGARFNLTTVKHYQVAQIDGQLLRALSNNGNKAAFLNEIELKVDGHIKGLTRTFATQLYRAGWGKIGSTATAAAAQTTLTLENIEDAVNFAEGQVIVASSSENAATLRNSGASLIVSSVNYASGVITFTTNINDIAALGVSDSLFIKGTRQNSATPTRLCVAGIGDWVPSTAPSASESFFGKDRSGNSRLFGPAVDVSGLSMSEGITKGIQSVRRFGGRPSHLFLNTKNYGDLLTEIQGRGRYDMTNIKAGTNGALVFPGFVIYTQYGPITVVDDPICPINRGYLLKLDSWALGSVGEAIGILDHGDNAKSLAVYNADALEIRIGGYPQLYTTHPGWNAVLLFAA